MAIALHHSRASGTALVILLGIANHDGDGGSWPSMTTLAKYGRCSIGQARRSVRKLEELGEVIVYQNGGGTSTTADHSRPNLYKITLSCPAECDRSKNHRTREPLAALDPLAPMQGDSTHAGGPPAPMQAEPSTNQTLKDINTKRQVPTRASASVAPAPYVPRYVPPAEPELDPALTEAEQAIADHAATLPCSSGARPNHWYPPTCRSCVQCGLTLDSLANQLQETRA